MRIQNNVTAERAYFAYKKTNGALAKNLEKLSSGYKINRSADDAAGLAISEKMRAQIAALRGAQRNAKDGISLIQTAEGALQEYHGILNRMLKLAEQSANGTYDDSVDRFQLHKEVDKLLQELDRIADATDFNGIKPLSGEKVERYIGNTSLDELADVPNLDDMVSNVSGTEPREAVAAKVATYEYEIRPLELLSKIDGNHLTICGFTYDSDNLASLAGSISNGDSEAAVTLLENVVEAWNADQSSVTLEWNADLAVLRTDSGAVDTLIVKFTASEFGARFSGPKDSKIKEQGQNALPARAGTPGKTFIDFTDQKADDLLGALLKIRSDPEHVYQFVETGSEADGEYTAIPISRYYSPQQMAQALSDVISDLDVFSVEVDGASLILTSNNSSAPGASISNPEQPDPTEELKLTSMQEMMLNALKSLNEKKSGGILFA